MAKSNNDQLTYVPSIPKITNKLTWEDRWRHIRARLGIQRMALSVPPGIYALGDPNEDAEIFVTGNYMLSFDALRSALPGINAYLLVLDTRGINVWCAAGEGLFGTAELIQRIAMTHIADIVRRRVLILPQLAAPGVSAHKVKQSTGFRVEYGPVRAKDLPVYLRQHKATSEMRQVRFSLLDRLVLIPVELVHILLPLFLVTIVLFFIGGIWPALGVLSAGLGGTVLFPILLPWLPTQQFSSKGLILGGVIALVFALQVLYLQPSSFLWFRIGSALAYLLVLPPITAFLALNFTGSTTFTSRTGVRHEIFRYVPIMAWSFGIGLILAIVLFIIRFWTR